MPGTRHPAIARGPSPYPTKWRQAVQDSIAKVNGGVIACVGDSTTAGTNLGSGVDISSAYPYQFYLALKNAGVPVTFDACAGQVTADARVVLTTGAAKGGQSQLCPGYALTATGGSLAFTPTSNVDTFDIYMIKGGASGTATVNINGGATLATLSTNGANAVLKVTVTATLGANTVNIVWASGSVWLQHIDAYDSTAKKLRVVGFGVSGYTSGNFVQTGFGPKSAIQVVAPALTVFNCWINDCNNSVALSTYLANMNSFITGGAKLSGDVLLVAANGIGTAVTETTQATYLDMLQTIAGTTRCALQPIRAMPNWSTYAAANSAGLMSDTLHPNATGYAQIGPHVAKPLLAGLPQIA